MDGPECCYSQILKHIGGWGRYQIILMVIAIPFAMAISFVGLTLTLLLYTPDHQCANKSGTVLWWIILILIRKIKMLCKIRNFKKMLHAKLSPNRGFSHC